MKRQIECLMKCLKKIKKTIMKINDEDESKYCDAECTKKNPPIEKKICDCMRIAENSSRFSVRVMEAMRQMQNEDEENDLLTSTVEEIVDYIQKNYRDDGDVYTQVRTTLKEICSQGFAIELLGNEYHLTGPNAILMNQTTCANSRKDCLLSLPIKKPKRRNNIVNDCECETTTDEESEFTSKNQKVSINETRKDFRKQEEKREMNPTKITPKCFCNEITDEDECICEIQENLKNNSKIQRSEQNVQENNSKKINEKRKIKMEQQPIFNSSKRKENNKRRKTIENNDRTMTENIRLNKLNSDNVDEIYNEIKNLIPYSKKHEKELKEWIKHCQEKCKQQAKRYKK